MGEGHFIQAGATPAGKAVDGFGEFITVDRLEKVEKDRIRARLQDEHQELFAAGTKIVRAKLDADAAFEKLRTDLHRAVGGDSVRTAIVVLTEATNKNFAADLAVKTNPKAK